MRSVRESVESQCVSAKRVSPLSGRSEISCRFTPVACGWRRFATGGVKNGNDSMGLRLSPVAAVARLLPLAKRRNRAGDPIYVRPVNSVQDDRRLTLERIGGLAQNTVALAA